ncbi:hypothetical protein [Arthrobacter sp. efr-133-R2A-63]|uniref:hypothetical protein n=1 Tax=Arthrobacter sp. efr-133-R2A-63 TaxID=3040278 RepID=UPI002551BC37|nr:hypothetical protein [Arthrobacter sp. efr-133-R2A-63]
MSLGEKLLDLTFEYYAAVEADREAGGLDYMRRPNIRESKQIAAEYEEALRELLQPNA